LFGLNELITKYNKAFNFNLLLSYFICQLITALVDHIISSACDRGGILIFLPGVSEIKQCIDAIRKDGHQKDVTILPLHANLSNDEQRRVFEKTKTWKIIAATNVAEVCDFLRGLPSLPVERFS
jgi:HrpA-like RNA helicase